MYFVDSDTCIYFMNGISELGKITRHRFKADNTGKPFAF